MGPQGLADEGEKIHSIVDEMEAEDLTAVADPPPEHEASALEPRHLLVTTSLHCISLLCAQSERTSKLSVDRT